MFNKIESVDAFFFYEIVLKYLRWVNGMDSKKALEILLQNIHDIRELANPENKWILHSIYVGLAARRIAHELHLDEDLALSIGYLHDIGRMFNHKNHVIEGYRYLIKLGYPNIARFCLTHSFVDNTIPNTIGKGPRNENYEFISNYLNNTELNIYDNIVQLCDLFCLETGFTTFEKRILDISLRKGIYKNSSGHFESIMSLKNRIEAMMGKEIYSLFPEIKKEDLNTIEKDRETLLELFQKEKKI